MAQRFIQKELTLFLEPIYLVLTRNFFDESRLIIC